MRTFWTDLRYGVRRLAGQPGFSVVAVITLALGIGANTAIYSVIDALLLRPLPYPRPLVQISGLSPGGFAFFALRPEQFAEWRRQSETFERVEAYSIESHVLSGTGEPRHAASVAVTGGLMELIGAVPRLGRTLQPSDVEPQLQRVAVISDGLWREHFGGAPDVIGKTVHLDDGRYEIVGVMRPEFRFPYGNRQIWLPLSPAAPAAGARATRFETIAVLRPGLTLEQAQARIDAVSAALAAQTPIPGGWGTRIRPFQEHRANRPVVQGLYVLFGAVAVVLLIACANIANLLLAQGTAREREVAVRAALGASRGRLVRQLLTETLALAAVGGLAGVCLAMWGVDLLAASAPRSLTFLSIHDMAVDRRALTFAVALTLATTLLFGIVPSMRGSRSALDTSLKSSPRGATASARQQRLRNTFVVAQLALSLVLLVAGGLLARTFIGLTRVDPGFEPKGLVAATVLLPEWKYRTPASQREFYAAALERLRALPGVEAVTLAGGMPPDGGSISFGLQFEVEGRGVVLDDRELIMPFAEVDGEYFDVLRIPILAGRSFIPADATGPAVSIVNETMARRLWGEPQLAVGRRYRTGARAPWRTVVGVVGDVYQFDHAKPRATFAAYYPQSRQPSLAGQKVIVTRAVAGAQLPYDVIRQQIWSVDPSQPIYDISSAEEMYEDFFAEPRFYAFLMTVFAGIGVCIAAVGLYGVLAYSVAQRTREFGIRVAFGARREDVMRLAMGHGARVTLAGLATGVLASALVTRGLASMLVGLSPRDPVTYAVTAGALGLVAAAASWVPGRRAARVDPAVALRQE